MKAITANHLLGGQVVFLATGGSWSEDMADACLFSDAESVATALLVAKQDEKAGLVVGAYEIDVVVTDGKAVPSKLRERIRAEGPTIGYGEAMKLEGFYAA